MKQAKNINTNVSRNWIVPKYILILYLFFLTVILVMYFYVSTSPKVLGEDLKKLASSRTTVTKELIANRGNIYDNSGNKLATSVTSYKLIAVLKVKDPEDKNYVVDKELTAKKLSEVLDAPYEYILSRLNKNNSQVEFGSYGSKLTELDKIAIEELDLPGIGFIESTKRFYPNGEFASYIIGYAKEYEQINLKLKEDLVLKDFFKLYYDKYPDATLFIYDEDIVANNGDSVKAIKVGNTLYSLLTKDKKIIVNGVMNVIKNDISSRTDTIIKGELGIESNFNDMLKGTNGKITYQRNPDGFKIPDTPETKVEAINGHDIYLTIDSNIQRFLESAVKEQVSKWKSEWMVMVVMDAKSGEILGSATSPSFNPNSLTSNMKYENPLVSYTYEPGSVMKIYSYLCANETGKYDGSKKYKSGSIKIGDYKVKDWNGYGWGKISYDIGFTYSSNVGAINLAKDYLTPKELKSCLSRYGFGAKTGIELSGENKGFINYNEKLETEWLSVSFGQGLTTTPIQQIQALSIIANEGYMVKPHIIKKTVNPVTKEEIEYKTVTTERITSKESANYVKKLMYDNVNLKSATGHWYYIKGFDVIGKTGTAQIAHNGKYLTGKGNYIISFAGMFPYEDPQYIIYTAISKPKNYLSPAIAPYVVDVIKNIAKYKNMYSKIEDSKTTIVEYKMENYVSQNTTSVKNKLSTMKIKTIVIGNGDKVINQYPSVGSKLLSKDKVFLVTNDANVEMPNMKGWSRSDVVLFASLANLDYEISGNGYVKAQNIKEKEIIGDRKISIILENKEVKKDETKEEKKNQV